MRKKRKIEYTVGYSVSMPQTSVMRQDVTEQTRDAFTVSQTYDSCGSVEYINGRSTLVALLAKNAFRLRVDGGFVSITGTPVYYYNLQDHLGSNRAVLNASGTLVQTDHYYPYGGLFADGNRATRQTRRHCDKELDRMHGLDLYDSRARHYDPATGRFLTIAPLCEKYYDVSPYAYCEGNPMKYIDIDGDSIFIGFREQEMILGYINSLSEGVFDVDDKGFLYMREGKKNVAGMYSMYYRNMLLECINTSNKIFVDMTESDGLVFFMGEKLDIHDYGDGMTINLPNSSYVYISGNDHTLNNSNEFKMYPEFILAHELVGHSIPAVISPSDYDSRMDGLAVTSENIIRKETMSPLRPWNTYSKNDWSVNGMTYSLSLVLIRTLFPKINFGQ